MKNAVKTVLVFLSVSAMLFSLAACIESEPAKEPYDSSATTSNTASQEETFSLNETAVFDTLKITATEIKESRGTEFFEPADGNVFVGIRFTVENISEDEQNVSSLLLFDAYADDVTCEYSFTAAAAFDGSTVDGTLAPGKKLIGWYTVEVPTDWEALELHVKANWLSSASAKFLFEK